MKKYNLTLPNIFGIIFYMPMSGEQMLKLYLQKDWIVISQRGSHVKVAKGNKRQVIPMHKELKKGLEKALLKYLAQEE
jgi:predicted RNA binding protein YcfA (HicA-like mRNA interferase family)